MAAGKRRRRKEQRAFDARRAAHQALRSAEGGLIRRPDPLTDISHLVVSPEDVRRAGTASEAPRWVVVSCAPMGERKAIASLRERRLWAYLPMQRFCRYRHGRKHIVERPLMVGYLFAVLPVGWHPSEMQTVAGVDGVLTKMDGRIAVIDPWHLVQMAALEASGVFDHTGEKKGRFVIDQAVKISGGQFIGWLATVVGIDGDKVRVMLDGQFKGVIPIKEGQLEAVDAKQAA